MIYLDVDGQSPVRARVMKYGEDLNLHEVWPFVAKMSAKTAKHAQKAQKGEVAEAKVKNHEI